MEKTLIEKMVIDYSKIDIYQGEYQVLSGIDLQVQAGEMVYLIGPVGSGKSSLIKTIYGELSCEGERAMVVDTDMLRLRTKRLPMLRRKIGMVFQDFRLLPDCTVHYNLDFVLRATDWKSAQQRQQRIAEVLAMVGMENALHKVVYELSGGEKQRVCVARALLNRPLLILADEPTGNLDPDNGEMILALLDEIRRQNQTAVVVSTHNMQWLDYFPGTVYRVGDGRLVRRTKDDAEADLQKELCQ